MIPLGVVGAGAMTSIGSGLAQTDAALRAGISRFRVEVAPDVWDGETIVALVPDDLLEPFDSAESPWVARLLALAADPIREACTSVSADRVVLVLGVPAPDEFEELPEPATWWAALERATSLRIDARRSRLVPKGRAAMFGAVDAAARICAADSELTVVCGAVDSYGEDARIVREQKLARTVALERAGDGRVLGEAAAFVAVRAANAEDRVVIERSATVEDPGHRFGDAPATGVGIANALEELRDGDTAFDRVWAGLAGESHDAKLWGVASLRHGDILPSTRSLLHPADRLGDAGAGLGAALFALAFEDLRSGEAGGRALLWASSDYGTCGCASMRGAPP